MTGFAARDPEFKTRVRAEFGRQRAMESLGVTIREIAPGRIVLDMPFPKHFSQQDGFVHAGILSAPLDSACGFAALTLFEAAARVLTVEFKINLLAPARGTRFEFVGEVVKPGRTITVAEAAAYGYSDAGMVRVATMTGTLIALRDPA